MSSVAKGVGRARGLLSFLPVVGVLALISVVYHTTTFILLDRWLGLGSQQGSRIAAAFTGLAVMCLLSFASAVLTDPGCVPASFAPEVEDPQRDGVQLKHCDKCGTYKPSRAHHCRVCKRCVLKMDHHCLWINNCVGFRNYKAFVIFVFFASIASICSAVIFICDVTHNERNFTQGASDTVFYVFYGLAVIFLSLILGTLLVWHVYLMARNMTTIEYRASVRAIWLARKSGQPYRHPFDLGLWLNFKSILGSNVLFWLWPAAIGHLKDGMHFSECHD